MEFGLRSLFKVRITDSFLNSFWEYVVIWIVINMFVLGVKTPAFVILYYITFAVFCNVGICY